MPAQPFDSVDHRGGGAGARITFPPGGKRIDVFDPDGVYLGTLPPDAPFPAAFTREAHPVVVERDDFDLPYLVVYRVERG